MNILGGPKHEIEHVINVGDIKCDVLGNFDSTFDY